MRTSDRRPAADPTPAAGGGLPAVPETKFISERFPSEGIRASVPIRRCEGMYAMCVSGS